MALVQVLDEFNRGLLICQAVTCSWVNTKNIRRSPGSACTGRAVNIGQHGHALCWAHFMAEQNPERSVPLTYSSEPKLVAR